MTGFLDAEPTEACTPWTTAGLVSALGTRYDSLDSYTLTDAVVVATDLLYVLTGRRWPGVCGPVTVRPCAQSAYSRNTRGWAYDQSWGVCGCGSLDTCGCGSRSRVGLGAYPIIEVSQVKVDGEVVAPSAYRLDADGVAGGWRWLVRIDDDGWPCCQDLDEPLTEDGTFGVTFTYGQAPPAGGVMAAAELAGEIARHWHDLDDCSIGPGVRQFTRQGMSVDVVVPGGNAVDELPFNVANWVRSVNPHNLQAEPSYWSPDSGDSLGSVIRHT